MKNFSLKHPISAIMLALTVFISGHAASACEEKKRFPSEIIQEAISKWEKESPEARAAMGVERNRILGQLSELKNNEWDSMPSNELIQIICYLDPQNIGHIKFGKPPACARRLSFSDLDD